MAGDDDSKIAVDAWEYCAWIGSLPGCSTKLTDAEQAQHMGWFKYNHIMKSGRKVPDAARPSQVRRWVDAQTGPDSWAAQCRFGTKRTGPAASSTTLRGWTLADPNPRQTALQIQEQSLRVEQAVETARSEQERTAAVWEMDRDRYVADGDMHLALVITDAIRDMRQFGRLQPSTKATMQALGLYPV
jgi:hypothetical protein